MLGEQEMQTSLGNHSATPDAGVRVVNGMPNDLLLAMLRALLPAMFETKLQTTKAMFTQPVVDDDDEEDQWRHEQIAAVDERNPLRSLGKAVSDTVLGDNATAPASPAVPKR